MLWQELSVVILVNLLPCLPMVLFLPVHPEDRVNPVKKLCRGVLIIARIFMTGMALYYLARMV